MIINFVMILGKVLRKFTHRLIKKYYPKVQITGAEQIPSDGPILFCANHPNSLIDPVLIGITAKRPVSFMAKAPLFKTPILGSIMHALGMIPAYRGRDDSSQVKKEPKKPRPCN
ncbi:MAG: 1-acyl-sn-glycerol-3-phosphate acyltransferase [Pirellulaceae bacterium]